MFGLGNKRKRKAAKENPQKEAVGLISRKVWEMEVRFANRLSLFERQLTTCQKKACLFIFCACMGSISIGLLVQGVFMRNNRQPVLLEKGTINIPQNTELPDSLNVEWLQELKRKRAEDRLKDTIK